MIRRGLTLGLSRVRRVLSARSARSGLPVRSGLRALPAPPEWLGPRVRWVRRARSVLLAQPVLIRLFPAQPVPLGRRVIRVLPAQRVATAPPVLSGQRVRLAQRALTVPPVSPGPMERLAQQARQRCRRTLETAAFWALMA